MIYKKYSELDAWIPTLGAGTYELTVNCSGVAESEFKGGTWYTSNFGKKLQLNKNGAKFKLWMTNVVPFTKAYFMFYECTGLTSVDTSAFTQVTNAYSMFEGCTGLTSIDTSGFTQVTDASHMFDGCTGLTSIDTSAFTQVTDAIYMFDGCTGLTSVDTSAFTQVTNAPNMFINCTGLTSIDTSGFTNVTEASYMFEGCTGLTTILFGTNNMPGTGTYRDAPIKVARVRGPNAEAVKAAVIAGASSSKWPTSATWTVEQTNEWKFVRVK